MYISGYTGSTIEGNMNFGSNDIILIKYNSNGQDLWKKQIGSSGSEEGRDLVIDSSNNLFITGNTNDQLDGQKHFGVNDIFVFKYDSEGNIQSNNSY